MTLVWDGGVQSRPAALSHKKEQVIGSCRNSGGQILTALGRWSVSSDNSEPRCPLGEAGGTTSGTRRSDLCWLHDPCRANAENGETLKAPFEHQRCEIQDDD